jgi:hypothetical protein
MHTTRTPNRTRRARVTQGLSRLRRGAIERTASRAIHAFWPAYPGQLPPPPLSWPDVAPATSERTTHMSACLLRTLTREGSCGCAGAADTRSTPGLPVGNGESGCQ